MIDECFKAGPNGLCIRYFLNICEKSFGRESIYPSYQLCLPARCQAQRGRAKEC